MFIITPRIYDGKCPTLRAQRDGILYVKNEKIYQLTGYEALLLQGFPKQYAERVKDVVSDRHLLMQAGNAMTVNVIEALGKQIIKTFKEDIKMIPGEEFEIECYDYLKERYKNRNVTFSRSGGMDSTISDIAVIKNGNIQYYIEAKMSAAQSGQFVLLPDEDTQSFIFSPRNHSEPNVMTDVIIDYMNQDFERFNNAGTAGEALNINPKIFTNWIAQHYENRNVQFFMSRKNTFAIFPIRKFADYFDVTAKYRIKKSGSSEPAKKDIILVENEIRKEYSNAVFTKNGKKLFVTMKGNVIKDRFNLGNYTYYFSIQSPGLYEIRKLSNTYNMNVIFSVVLKKSQDNADLLEFESSL